MKKKYKLFLTLFIVVLVSGCLGADNKGMFNSNYVNLIEAYDAAEGGWPLFNASDTIYLSDKVHRMKYDASHQKTAVWFTSLASGKPVWIDQTYTKKPSDGDLTPYYRNKDKIDLDLHIISIDGTHYETIKEWYP